VKRFKGTKILIRDFGIIADILGEQMGCFLFQLPPSYHLYKGPAQFDRKIPRAATSSIRHKSWWNDEVYRLPQSGHHRSCSGLRRPDELIGLQMMYMSACTAPAVVQARLFG
jgi:uncharacterized protein YecE (DUF72 family)